MDRIGELVLDDAVTPRPIDALPAPAGDLPDELASTSDEAALLDQLLDSLEWCRKQTDLPARIIWCITSAVNAKDQYTCGHSDRVARIAVRLAQELGCDIQTRKTLYLAGVLHDIGKIGIDGKVLGKAGPLSQAEYEHIKQHTEIGHRILYDLPKLHDVLQVVRHHHESWDGGGYPDGLDGERIPLAARIVAVADAFDAMSSDRPYRKAMSDHQVDRILGDGAGRQWDPRVIDAYFRCRGEIRVRIRGT